ncbi:hypothetical protein ES319_A11G023300v1 [Gossypium barbadense]|uniref:CLAVATA3/ESR-like protein n=2 Tax=Gossypium TaxID=3633 RepID=A0A5J5TH22_GOSBA|nr:hypothetical protein ES319_A11G023300v1 [Gossypium barbadense]TYG92354.1 hypothetical protein ES288_A11G023400v1 [Gossypium darwinii]
MIIICNPKFLFIFFTIIFSTVNLSSCGRYTLKTINPEEPTTMATELSTTWFHFPAAKSTQPSVAEKSTRPIYEVSYRTVPGGPNPLHN